MTLVDHLGILVTHCSLIDRGGFEVDVVVRSNGMITVGQIQIAANILIRCADRRIRGIVQRIFSPPRKGTVTCSAALDQHTARNRVTVAVRIDCLLRRRILVIVQRHGLSLAAVIPTLTEIVKAIVNIRDIVGGIAARIDRDITISSAGVGTVGRICVVITFISHAAAVPAQVVACAVSGAVANIFFVNVVTQHRLVFHSACTITAGGLGIGMHTRNPNDAANSSFFTAFVTCCVTARHRP